MVKRGTQVSRPKVSNDGTSPKSVPRLPARTPIVNGHRDDDSSLPGTSSNTEAITRSTETAVQLPQTGERVTAQDIVSSTTNEPGASQSPSSAETDTEEHGNENVKKPKARGRAKKNTNKDVISEEVPRASTSAEAGRELKRRVAAEQNPKEAPSEEPVPKVRGKKTKAAEAATSSATVDTENKDAASVKSDQPKTRKRKVVDATKAKSAPSIAARGRKPGVSSKTKAKRQKVELEVPRLRGTVGRVFVMGENEVGQLGFGEEVEGKKRPTLLDLPFSIVDVVAGGMHSVCLTENGEVVTFGCNDEGALGRLTAEEGSERIPRRVDIPERIVQVSAGDSHTAALAESGQVYLWGNFRRGDGPLGLTADGANHFSPVTVLRGVTVVKVASGGDHLVCLSQDGNVYTCGCAEAGQLGRVSQRNSHDGGRRGRAVLLEPSMIPFRSMLPFSDVGAGLYCTYLTAQESNMIYAFGLNNFSQLGIENENFEFFPKQISSFNGKTWRQINGGQHHTLALDDDGQVHSLGRHNYGRLGLGEDATEKSVPTPIPTLSQHTCSEVSSGNCVSFALDANGAVYSWGMGTTHQLGQGNDEDKVVPTRIEGNFFSSWKALKVSSGGQHTLILAVPKEGLSK